ncbi:hypothetical protein LTR36_007763 [Oleoguttula mirabilis]|uniref:F-box domain-containing protein n=1 Tax=Oleoguttula mirabilis TaxID=1507867 RepID=A0AAV9JB36_9PEZI|nr:hypothetical protein LTR36_007763 [Oleoguttula mirabilis]
MAQLMEAPALPDDEKHKADLHSLPNELLALIFNFIQDPAAVNAIRLTCRVFERESWVPFARSFNHRVFHLTACSLQALLTLSHDPRTAPHIEHLHISTVRPSSDGLRALLLWIHRAQNQEAYVSRKLAYRPYERLHSFASLYNGSAYYSTQAHLDAADANGGASVPPSSRDTGRAAGHDRLLTPTQDRAARVRKALIEALTALRALTKITVVDDAAHADGAKIYDLRAHHETYRPLLEAIEISGAGSRLTHFNVIGDVDITALPRARTPLAPASMPQPLLPQLQELLLPVTVANAVWRARPTLSAALPRTIPAFLLGCPNLTSLAIDFPAVCQLPDCSFSAYHGFPGNVIFDPMASFHFPHLRHLEFLSLHLQRVQPLVRFLGAHAKTLTRLVLLSVMTEPPGHDAMFACFTEELNLVELVFTSNVVMRSREQVQAIDAMGLRAGLGAMELGATGVVIVEQARRFATDRVVINGTVLTSGQWVTSEA